jgi:hypothetical protein
MSDEQNSKSTRFMLEEYHNIAATHDKLRDHTAHLFNFFLIMTAVPFTIAGIALKNVGFDLFHAPPSLHLLFLLLGAVDFFMAMAIVDARLDQYRYARTVNLIRAYFADLDKEIIPYLYLPTSPTIPPFSKLGYVGSQANVVAAIGALYTGYGMLWVFEQKASFPFGVSGVLAIAVAIIYVAAYILYRVRRAQAMGARMLVHPTSPLDLPP